MAKAYRAAASRTDGVSVNYRELTEQALACLSRPDKLQAATETVLKTSSVIAQVIACRGAIGKWLDRLQKHLTAEYDVFGARVYTQSTVAPVALPPNQQ